MKKMAATILALACTAASAQWGGAAGSFLDGYEQGRREREGRPYQGGQERSYRDQRDDRRVAHSTGGRRYVDLVGGGYGVACEYRYAGDTFWRAFRGGCPPTVTLD